MGLQLKFIRSIILFHHFYTEKQVYVCYFLRITAPRPLLDMFSYG